MKLREKFRRFWTMDVHNHEGFTLVELIIVIAILAILSGVAVVGYSAYVKKANMQADKTMIVDIMNALNLAYYADSDSVQNGMIVLNLNDVATAEGQFVLDALVAAYGDNWAQALKLKSDEWNTFQSSNFYSDQDGLVELLGTVETLTGALGLFLENDSVANALGGNFLSYMDGMGATSAAERADAAVFYVADVTAGLDAATLENAVAAINANASKGPLAVMNGMDKETGSTIASAAALYALAEGYATFFDAHDYEVTNPDDDRTPREILDEATEDMSEEAGGYTGSVDAFTALLAAFSQMGNANTSAMNAYMAQTNGTSPMSQDMNAYAEVMKTVSASKDGIINSNQENGNVLGSANYFSNEFLADVLSAYAQGGVIITVVVKGNEVKIASSVDDQL